jgi:hypothetical protein
VIGLAVFSALGVTLYRNDVLRDLAKSAGQERAYLNVERSLGSPGFGTPRAVEHLATLATPTFASDSTPVRRTSRETTRTTPSSANTPATDSSTPSATSGSTSPGSSAAGSSTSDSSSSTSSPAESTKPEKKTSLESLVAAQIGAPTTRKSHGSTRADRSERSERAERAGRAERSERAERSARRERASSSDSEPSLGIKGSSNRFDPLNGKL